MTVSVEVWLCSTEHYLSSMLFHRIFCGVKKHSHRVNKKGRQKSGENRRVERSQGRQKGNHRTWNKLFSHAWPCCLSARTCDTPVYLWWLSPRAAFSKEDQGKGCL